MKRGVGRPPGGGGKAKIYSRPESLPNGEILEDIFNHKWKMGKAIGSGGFGDIYLASSDPTKPVTDKTADHVVKIEPFLNGPLFVENSFYVRNAKEEMIEKWKSERRLDSLGMPCFVSSGNHEYNSQHYRFMVLRRYGQDLQKVIEAKPGKRLSCRAVQALALQILDVLEYIHSKNYIHADVKASNLLLNLGKRDQAYLVDYGLAAKYVQGDGRHVDYTPDNRQAHNGTLEYTSRDAHIGVCTRRGDLEILGYNMMEWLCGKLPWSNTDPPTLVHKQKVAFMNNIQLKKIYMPDIPGLDLLERYLKFVAGLTHDQTPNYNQIREILKKDLPNKVTSLYLDDVCGSPKKKRPSAKAQKNGVVEEVEVVRKKIKVPEDDLSSQKRATRTTKKVTKNFNWTNVLSSNPESIIRSSSQVGGSHSPPDLKSITPITGTLTPAMLQILAKKKENVFQSPLAVKGHHSSGHFPEGTSKLTPAMQEILMRTKRKKLRKSLSMNALPTAPPARIAFTQPNQNKHNNVFKPVTPKITPLSLTTKVPSQPLAASSPKVVSSQQAPSTSNVVNGTGKVSTRAARYIRRRPV